MTKRINALTSDDLRMMQEMPLSLKERWTVQRLREFIDYYGEDKVYYGFSGGKDSTALRHIIKKYWPDIPGVFVDTPMEYPQVRRFAKEKDGVVRLRPEGTIKQIIDDCGWNFPSKDVAQIIEAARRDKKWAIDRLNGIGKDGKPSQYREMYKKWWPLVDAPFKVSDRCCIRMKESVVEKYEKETGRHPILALMADESARRKEAYLRSGCNMFEENYVLDPETGEEIVQKNSRPMSKPMGFWTENDVLQYLYENKLPIAEPYGQIVEVHTDMVDGQMNLFDIGACESCQGCKFKTTGEPRTGCMFCTVGCHLDHFAKIKRLKAYAPKLYDYCMDYLGEREVLMWIEKHYCKIA